MDWQANRKTGPYVIRAAVWGITLNTHERTTGETCRRIASAAERDADRQTVRQTPERTPSYTDLGTGDEALSETIPGTAR